MLTVAGFNVASLLGVWLAATAWPHVEVLLHVIASVVRHPLAIPLYAASIAFEAGVCIVVSRIALWDAERDGIILDRAKRQSQLARLGDCMRRDSVRTAAAIALPVLLAGVVGMTYTREWSLDNAVCGLIVIGVAITLFMPMVLAGYTVFRYYLLKHGCFVPYDKPTANVRRARQGA